MNPSIMLHQKSTTTLKSPATACNTAYKVPEPYERDLYEKHLQGQLNIMLEQHDSVISGHHDTEVLSEAGQSPHSYFDQ